MVVVVTAHCLKRGGRTEEAERRPRREVVAEDGRQCRRLGSDAQVRVQVQAQTGPGEILVVQVRV